MRTRGLVTLGASVALAMTLISSGAAVAQDEEVVYSGCLDMEGLLSKVAVGEEPLGPCDKSQQLAQWNQEGPEGPQGEQGAAGEQGAQGEKGEQGEQGDPGLTNIYRIKQSFAGTGLVNGVIKCDEGDLVTGGGYRMLAGPATTVAENYPSGARGWTVSMLVADGSLNTIEYEVHAVCSDLEPLRG